jgi:hypothetical protein
MSLLTNQTNINQDQAFFLLANMSSVNSGSISTAQITTSSIGAITANVSTLTVNTAFISTASVQQGTFSSIYTGYTSSGNADLQDITTSTIFATAGVFINGAELTTLGGNELLLNGVPLATTSNLSSIADWAYEPAISSVNMSGFDVLNGGLISSLNVRAGSAFFNNLLAWNVLAVSSFTSTISSLSVVSENVSVSSITELGTAASSYITFNSGDIYLNSAAGGSGIYLTPQDEVAIQDPATGQTYGLLAQYIRGVSSISDVSTINNLPYPYIPPGTGSTISTFQTLTATDWVSSAQLFVSSINGSEFNQNSIIISTFVSDSLSSVRGSIQLNIVSSIQLNPSASFSPNLSIDMGLGSLFTNVAGAALGGMNMIVGGIALATGVTAIYQARQKNTIQTSNFELVNGMTQLQFSTLGQDVSSIIRFVSSVNEQTPGEEYFISTIIPANTTVIRSFSDPMNTISSPSSTIQAFGQWVEVPATGGGPLEFSTLQVSTLVAADLVSTFAIEVQNVISTNGISAQYVIGEQIISTPLIFVSSINNAEYPPIPALVSSFPGNIFVADSIFAANLVSSFNMLVGNTISTNGLSAGYTIASALVSTPQLFVSSINNQTYPPPQDVISTFAGNIYVGDSVSTPILLVSSINGSSFPQASAFDVEGLQNKLGIFPALPLTSDVVELAANNDLTPPTAIVPDATAPTSSTTPTGTVCWLYTKPNTNAGFNWYMYNPRFGSPAAPLPYRKYSSNPAQDRIQSVWALVQPAVNTNIYTAGIIALNLYSYDDANPPTTGFYNSRWAYSNTAGTGSGQTGINLYAGFTYLIYAYDAPRTANQVGVGTPDIQDWGLRDPYDIYPDVNHIPLQNCVLAFNPWTDGTNYQSWTTTGLYTNGQTVIFSGFGGTPNGIFYTAVGTVPVNTPPVSATGVPSPFWTAISPQPSSYASQPILATNLNGISGTATGWTAGPLLRVLSIGYTTGPNPYTRTSSVRYVLN